ncbi:MAG: UDP-N-acetylmuramoyl-L-alanine--D-glutamate ligase [Burkholderiales bacterium]|jgi:UDP-N-acetylmuramoylalanine--D-glutamate ligase|nr:UDP-N-acetylmuramoyl-L-alanine--D-glutamate ligase [Burkholderiales bacterium]
MNGLQNQHVLVLGLGISGLAMARWCARCGARVTVADTRATPPGLAALQADLPQARFVTGAFDASLVEGSDIRAVFRSPGLSPGQVAPVVDAARALGLWTGGELDLFARALADLREDFAYTPRVIAITGTNGKTTVTSLTGQLVERAGRRVAVAGNIGPSMLDTLAAQLDTLPADLPRASELAPEPELPEPVEEAGDAAVAARPGTEVADDADAAAPETDESAAAAAAPAVEAAPAADEPAVDAEEAEPRPTANDLLPEIWVLELSSFQLEGVQGFEPTVGAVLNITQDHLDWHGDMVAYAAAKQRVFGERGAMLLNRDDPQVAAMTPPVVKVPRGQKPVLRPVATFGTGMPVRPGDWGIEDMAGMVWLVRAMEADETRKRRKDEEEEIHIQRLMPADALRIRGRHNAANALAALALATSAGCPLAPMLYGLREYRGEPHRVEPVGIVRDVEYFDDSKGTNVGATVAALQGLGAERQVVVILGGEGKGQDFSPLAAPLARFARAAVLIGRDAPLIRAALEGSGVALVDAADMADAVARATERAHAGDAVLLSPACASFDMFDNYGHRGQVFQDVVASMRQDAGEVM